MEILKIKHSNIESELILLINKIEEWLKQGKVLVFPTDTVYGLIADANNIDAIKKIFKIKKRNTSQPLPLFVSNIIHAKELAKISSGQEGILNKIWPGKVTVVFEKKSDCQAAAVQGEQTIALRIPDYYLIKKTLEQTKMVLTGTSANISGKPYSCEVNKILKQFENQNEKPDVVIDVGSLPPSKPSTIIDLTKPAIKTLRE